MRRKITWTAIFGGGIILLAAGVLLASFLTASPAPAARAVAIKTSQLQVWEHSKGGRYLQAVTWDLEAAQINPQELFADATLAFSYPPPAGSSSYKAAMLDAELAAQQIQAGGNAGPDISRFAGEMRAYRAAVTP
jgi:hypothetical protein